LAKAVKHLAQKPPYSDTTIPYGKSKSDIEEMLKEFGAKALRWTETPASMQYVECPILEFILEVEIKGVQKQIGVRIQPPMLVKTTGKGYRRRNTSNPAASMRLLYWYLKSKMEATMFGLDDAFETFMSKVMISLPDGTTETMGKVVEEQPHVISELLPNFTISPRPALDQKKQKETIPA